MVTELVLRWWWWCYCCYGGGGGNGDNGGSAHIDSGVAFGIAGAGG